MSESERLAHIKRRGVEERLLGVEAERDRYRDVLEEAVALLGSGQCEIPGCEGCKYERDAVTDLIRAAFDERQVD